MVSPSPFFCHGHHFRFSPAASRVLPFEPSPGMISLLDFRRTFQIMYQGYCWVHMVIRNVGIGLVMYAMEKKVYNRGNELNYISKINLELIKLVILFSG